MKRYSSLLWYIVLPLAYGLLISKVGNFVGDRLAAAGYGNRATNGLLLTLAFLALYVVVIQLRFRRRMKKLHSKQRETELKIFEQQRALFKDEEIPDRVAVNAALNSIVASEGQDTEAITIVLKFASRVQPNSGQWYERIDRQSTGGSFRGLTAEIGEIEVRESRDPPQHTSSGFQKERVGQYKLWRDVYMVFFQHYWASDLTTTTNPLDAFKGYAILFNPSTFQQAGYGLLEHETFSMGLPLEKQRVLLLVNVLTGGLKGSRIPFGLLTTQ